MQEYADPVIDWLDAGQGILRRRLFREVCATSRSSIALRERALSPRTPQSCTQLPNGSYTKNLALVEQDLSRICLVDNSPICYSVNESTYFPLVAMSFFHRKTQRRVAVNGIPIEGWTHDPSDEALLDLLPVLDSLRFTSDVRRVLGIRGYS